MKKRVVLWTLCMIVALAGCTDKEKIKEPAKSDRAEALAKYTGMSQSDLWKAATEDKDIYAYDAYVTNYPKGEHADQAKKELLKMWKEKAAAMSGAELAKATAVIETNRGVIKFKFYPEVAIGHVRNFVALAQSHFYDGTIFHRVIDGFMIQGGDPTGTGRGGPGYTINAEFNDKPHLEGTVSMARSSDPDSAGSQFFICLAPQPGLDHQYSVFGQVIEGMDVVHAIGKTRTDPRDRPVENQVMEKVYIEGL